MKRATDLGVEAGEFDAASLGSQRDHVLEGHGAVPGNPCSKIIETAGRVRSR